MEVVVPIFVVCQNSHSFLIDLEMFNVEICLEHVVDCVQIFLSMMGWELNSSAYHRETLVLFVLCMTQTSHVLLDSVMQKREGCGIQRL